MAIHNDNGCIAAFFAGESQPRLGDLLARISEASLPWIRKRLDELTPEEVGLDQITFNEERRRILAELRF